MPPRPLRLGRDHVGAAWPVRTAGPGRTGQRAERLERLAVLLGRRRIDETDRRIFVAKQLHAHTRRPPD